MAFPVILMGSEGEQFNTYGATDARWPLGTQLVLQDGRKFRFAKAGGSTLAVGDVEQSAAPVSNDVGRAGIAAAIGATSPTLTLGGATTANLYAQGYWINSVTPGAAELYRIDNHLAGTTAVAFNFSSGYALKTAVTTTTRVDLIKNPFDAIIQLPATQTGAPCGVACSAPTTTQYGWVATAGVAAVLTSGTLVIGNPAGTAVGAGAVSPLSATIAVTLTQNVIGNVVRVAASGAWSTIHLTLD